MPEFDPLARKLVDILSSHANTEEKSELQTWLKEYGLEIHPDYVKDLYIKLSHSMILRIGREAHNDRQRALIQDYEAWVLDPNPETKRTLKNQRSRLYNNVTYRYQKYGESIRVGEALLDLSRIAQPRQTLDTIVENIIDATLVDEATFAEDQRRYQLKVAYYHETGGLGQDYDEYCEQRRWIYSPQRGELLRFCISEFQRIATSPANVLHVA
jgi:hypothetical protein